MVMKESTKGISGGCFHVEESTKFAGSLRFENTEFRDANHLYEVCVRALNYQFGSEIHQLRWKRDSKYI